MMFENKLISSRQAFANAIKARNPKEEVMLALGIAQSTYYKWKARFEEYGFHWVNGEPITRSIRFADLTLESTHKQIVELSLQYPTLGPKVLATIFIVEYNSPIISPSTIHNILTKYNLGNRARRATELHRRFLEGESLTLLQERLVETIDPLVSWQSEKGRQTGEILTQDVYRFHHSSPFGTAPISIVVDTFSGIAFACFIESTRVELTTDCARMAIERFKQSGHMIKDMYVDSGHDFGKYNTQHPYLKLLRKHNIERVVIRPRTNRRNPYLLDVWYELRRFLCEGGIAEPEKYRNSLSKLNPLIKEFLDSSYNA